MAHDGRLGCPTCPTGGLKVWVLDGFRKRIRGKTSTHTVRVTIEPSHPAGGEVAFRVQD